MNAPLQEAWAQRLKLRAEGYKLRAEGSKLYAEGAKLYAEGAKLYAEGNKLCVEGNRLWAQAIIDTHGPRTTMEWITSGDDAVTCRLGTGEEFHDITKVFA